MKVFKPWANEKYKPKDNQCLPPQELDTISPQFFCEVHKRDDNEYERAFIAAMQGAIDR